MSSGIGWMYRVQHLGPKAPMSFDVGISWASGNVPDKLVVSSLRGYGEMLMEYRSIPGFVKIQKGSNLFGSHVVMEEASSVMLVKWSKDHKVRPPRGVYGDCSMTVGDFLREYTPCGNDFNEDIANAANAPLEGLFLDHWEALAIAADSWPRAHWGKNCMTPEDLIVSRLKTAKDMKNEERRVVLDVLSMWADGVKDERLIPRLRKVWE